MRLCYMEVCLCLTCILMKCSAVKLLITCIRWYYPRARHCFQIETSLALTPAVVSNTIRLGWLSIVQLKIWYLVSLHFVFFIPWNTKIWCNYKNMSSYSASSANILCKSFNLDLPDVVLQRNYYFHNITVFF